MEWARKHTAKWILVTKNEDGTQTAHCTCCDKDVDIKAKHRTKVTCPNCGKEMEVIHKWRLSYFEDDAFVAIPKALNNKEIMLRYLHIGRKYNTLYGYDNVNHPHIEEVARMVITENDSYTFEKQIDGGWIYSKKDWFAEYNMANYRRLCCLQADEYSRILTRELRKTDWFKYMTPQMIHTLWNDKVYVNGNICGIGARSDLYERLLKVGLTVLAIEDICSYYGNRIEYDKNETALTKMLGINKNQLKILAKHQTLKSLEILRKVPNADEELIDICEKANVSAYEIEGLNNAKKVIAYAAKQNIRVHEWKHYFGLLEDLGYDKDESYLYPKDFRKMESAIVNEVKIKKNAKNDPTIMKIAEGLKNNKELRDMFAGSDGLMVYVPESTKDLIEEGAKLHNCLSTYIDRVAEGKTLIFFIRKIEDPTAPYVAMEYCHGRVIQCREDYNKTAEPKVLDFAAELARRLAKQNLLVA